MRVFWQVDGYMTAVERCLVRILHISASPWLISSNELNRLVLVADKAHFSLFGRLVADQENFKLVKKWLHLCKTRHGSDCDSPFLATENGPWQLPCFKVIDV